MHGVYIELVLNNICNFKCTYCIGNLNNNMSDNHIDIANIARLVYYLNKYLPDRYKYFKLLGGEPLLYPHLSEVYNILSKCNNCYISIDTNGSIEISDILLRNIKSCIKNNNIVEYIFSYHLDGLSNKSYLNNYYNNIQKMIDNDIKYLIRCIYDDTIYQTLKEHIEKIKKKFGNTVKIEQRHIFHENTPSQTRNNNICYPYRFFGIFPHNKLYYSCFREIYGDNYDEFEITKNQIMRIIQRIDKAEIFPICNHNYNPMYYVCSTLLP